MSPTIDSSLQQKSKKRAMVAQVPVTLKSKTYFEALNYKDAPHWKKAMESELSSMHKNNTWTIVMLPPTVFLLDVGGYIKLN